MTRQDEKCECLATCGADVTGIDFSPRPITYAKKAAARKRLNIRYLHHDYLEFDTDEQFDLVLMIMCDFCALSPVQRKGPLRKFHRMLTTMSIPFRPSSSGRRR